MKLDELSVPLSRCLICEFRLSHINQSQARSFFLFCFFFYTNLYFKGSVESFFCTDVYSKVSVGGIVERAESFWRRQWNSPSWVPLKGVMDLDVAPNRSTPFFSIPKYIKRCYSTKSMSAIQSCLAEAPPTTQIRICCEVNSMCEWNEWTQNVQESNYAQTAQIICAFRVQCEHAISLPPTNGGGQVCHDVCRFLEFCALLETHALQLPLGPKATKQQVMLDVNRRCYL